MMEAAPLFAFRKSRRPYTAMPAARVWRVTALTLCITAIPAQPVRAQNTAFHDWWSTFLRNHVGPSSAGYAWVVMQRGAILSQGGGGFERIDSTGSPGGPMTPSTRMQIASASKPITAMALQLAAHERGISLDTPIVDLLHRFVSQPGAGVGQITLRHLLQHRSGYPFGYVWPPREANLRALLARDLPNPPGEVARYSNINYSLARTVIEEVTGQSYLEFVQQRMLTPSGISGATLINQPGDAFAHRFSHPVRGTALVWDFDDDAGGYGWYMTALDLARWGQALLEGRLLPQRLLGQALADSLGWGRATTSRGAAHIHQGQWIISGNMGVRTGIALLPDSVVAVLYLNTNVPYSPAGLLVRAFESAVPTFVVGAGHDQQTATVHITTPVAAEELRYTLDGGEPTASSKRYEAPIPVSLPARLRVRAFSRGEPWGFSAQLLLPSRGQTDP